MKKTLIFCIMLIICQQAGAVGLIELNYTTALTEAQRQNFDAAASFWNSVITGYDLTIAYDNQNKPLYDYPHQLTIDVSLPYKDGVGGLLGQAGPTTANYYDNNPIGAPTVALWYATAGVMEFDSADVDNMIANDQFYAVVLHEMAHVIGFGTLWTYNHNLEKTIYPMYVTGSGEYLGIKALENWKTEFSGQSAATFVPVELEGADGTANGHWNEVSGGSAYTGITSSYGDLANELMTGWLNENIYLSKTTLGAIDDLGYIVDYSKAGFIIIPEAGWIGWSLACVGMLLRRRRTGSNTNR